MTSRRTAPGAVVEGDPRGSRPEAPRTPPESPALAEGGGRPLRHRREDPLLVRDRRADREPQAHAARAAPRRVRALARDLLQRGLRGHPRGRSAAHPRAAAAPRRTPHAARAGGAPRERESARRAAPAPRTPPSRRPPAPPVTETAWPASSSSRSRSSVSRRRTPPRTTTR